MLGSPVTITPPAAELITTAQAKSFLRIDGDDLDFEVGMMTNAAITDLEAITSVRLLDQTVEMSADCFADLAHLRIGPVTEIASIKYRDVNNGEQTVAAELYELVGAPLEQGVRLIEGSWPTTRSGRAPITIRLDVGYGADAADVPDALKFAAFALLRGKAEGASVDISALIANHRIWL